jgi:integrase
MLADRKHGTWGFSVSGPVDRVSGKRLQVRRTGFSAKREAQRECAAAVQGIANGAIRAGGSELTVGAWLTEWLDRRERDGLRDSTVAAYRRYVRRDLVPALGHLRLRDLRRHDVDRLLQELGKDGRGVTTIRLVHAVLSSSLSAALQLELVQQNVASNVALPRRDAKKVRVWQPQEVSRFLELAESHRLGALFDLVVRTGLRRGEVAGLKWQDIDLEAGRITVRRQRVQVDTVVVTNEAKTEHGQDRRVTLDKVALQRILGWKVEQDREREIWENQYHDDGWVFTYEDGRPLSPYYISQSFRTLVDRAELPHLTFHGLRHEHASLLLAAGMPITAVSKRLGHASSAITSDLYSHLLDDIDRQMADAIEGVLDGSSAGLHTHRTRKTASEPVEDARTEAK